MKKLLLVVVILSFSVFNLKAQDMPKHEFKVGYGTLTSNQFIDFFSDIVTYPISLGSINYEDEKYLGPLYLSYNYSINEWVDVGAIFAYERISESVLSRNDKIGDEVNNIYTIGLQSNFNYLHSDLVKLYSGVGVALTISSNEFENTSNQSLSVDKDVVEHFNFQVTAFGVRVGKGFGVFGEVGFGYKGILNAGVSYRF